MGLPVLLGPEACEEAEGGVKQVRCISVGAYTPQRFLLP